MKKTFSVSDCVSALPALVPSWPYVKTILNFGPAFDLNDSDWVDTFNRQRVVYGLPDEPEERAERLESLHVDLCVSANELNKREDLDLALAELAKLNFDCCVIQIDEGTRTGRATSSKKKGYHRNQPVEAYVRAIQQNFHRYDLVLRRDRNVIVIHKGKKFFELEE